MITCWDRSYIIESIDHRDYASLYSRTCLNEDNGDQKLLFVKAGYQFRHIPWYTGTWLGPEIFSQLEVIRLVGISLGIFYCIMQAKYFVF